MEHIEEQWHYEGGRRDLRLDLLRGFAAFAMIADHIGGRQSWLYPLTGGDRFFVSAAEAFVFISGVVMGIVYLKVAVNRGVGAAMRKALERARDLYLVTVVLTLGFAALGWALGLWWAPDTTSGGPAGFALDVVTMQRTLYLVDIPLMYTLLLVGACPVIFLLTRGQTPLVLAGSAFIWLAWQILPGVPTFLWTIEDNSVFHVPAWQFLFVLGIVIGWHRVRLERWFGSLPRRPAAVGLVAASAVVVTLYIIQTTMLESLEDSRVMQEFFLAKDDVPAGRVLVFLLLAVTAFAVTTEFWQPIKRLTGWLLLPLGQNALTAYSLHVLVVAAMTYITVTAWPGGASTFAATLMQVAGVAVVWAVVVFEPGLKQQVVGKTRSLLGVAAAPGETNAQA